MLSIINLYTLFSQMGPLAHASQQGCPPKPPEQSDPEHTVLLLVPSRTTSTSELYSKQHNLCGRQARGRSENIRTFHAPVFLRAASYTYNA